MPPHGMEGDAAQAVAVPRQRAQQLALPRPQLGGRVGGAGGQRHSLLHAAWGVHGR